MLAKVYSCAVIGLEAAIVEVEVDTANGLPSFVDVSSDSQCRSPVYGKVEQDHQQEEVRVSSNRTPRHSCSPSRALLPGAGFGRQRVRAAHFIVEEYAILFGRLCSLRSWSSGETTPRHH
jgi:hypothetical protein